MADLIRLAVEMYGFGVLLTKSRSPDGQGFVLKEHKDLPDPPRSPYFISLRSVARKVRSRQMIAGVLVGYAHDHGLEFERLADIPLSMSHVVTSMSDVLQMDIVTPRLDPKLYGEQASVLGDYEPGMKVLLVDDMCTNGKTKKKAAQVLAAVGLKVKHVLVVIDREEGGAAELAEVGLTLHRLYTMRELLDIYLAEGLVSQEDDREIRQYLDAEAA